VHDALFQPESRERYRALLGLGYTDAFRSLHPGEGGQFTFWDYFRQAFEHNRGIRIDHFLLSPRLAERLKSCEIFSRLNYCVRVQWCALCSSIVHALRKEAAAVVL
jgi:exonuclease III